MGEGGTSGEALARNRDRMEGARGREQERNMCVANGMILQSTAGRLVV